MIYVKSLADQDCGTYSNERQVPSLANVLVIESHSVEDNEFASY